ncbi:hypothetical protein IEQ44_07225 [Nocardioides sp. Y6]|uniref:Uncharacterized protein n=1 Tax=Nocardioides malaquae TaxID=2773426 RepID=A0ABR9RST3_9ACTN|nr:hypothetical protein [Nocardioides malaquae]MBE7324440.1 hypothetical protein [Nocardioides malaquae]
MAAAHDLETVTRLTSGPGLVQVRGQEGAPLLVLGFTAFAPYQRFGNGGACGVR